MQAPLRGRSNDAIDALLPVLSVERADREAFEQVAIEASHIHIDVTRMGTWSIKGVNATCGTERVFCHAGVEGVRAKRVPPVEQREPLGRHDEMKEGLHAADRAVALQSLEPV